MNPSHRMQMAMGKAHALVRELRIETLPVDPFAIAAKRDIDVKPKPDAAEGVSGMLLRHGDAFGILYATHIRSEGFQRFSVAHELGHYFLDGHIDHVLPSDGVHTSEAGFVSADPYELEADQFAAGLLMPTPLFRRAISNYEASLSAIEEIASLCKTSLTATAIRYAQLSEDAVAIVVSTGTKVEYAHLSNTMKLLPEFAWPRKGSPVPRGTATANFNVTPGRVAQSERADAEIDILDWLGGARSARATEEVIGLGSYGKTLTVLTCPSVIDETFQDDAEDEEDEKDLIERWTPRFHR